MTLAAVLAMTALASVAPLDLVRKLLRQDNPFTAAPRLADRLLAVKPSQEGVWRRYDGPDYFVELGPFAARTPQKIVITTRFPTRPAALAYAEELFAAFPTAPTPRFPLVVEGPFSYRGALVIKRRPVGLEVDLAQGEGDWRVTVTLIAGGPRIVVPMDEPDS